MGGVGGMENGKLRMGNGDWDMEDGRWEMGDGRWKMAWVDSGRDARVPLKIFDGDVFEFYLGFAPEWICTAMMPLAGNLGSFSM